MCGNICLCVNTEILHEYEEILTQKTTHLIANNIVETIARLHTTYYQETYIHFDLIKEDVDDNKFVDCAIASGAKYIVTNDNHFAVLQSIPWPRLEVINIKDFLKMLHKD